MKTLYKAILTEFDKEVTKVLFTEQNISPVLYIDLYAGQEQFEENYELFTQNALLVEWDVDYSADVPIATVTLYCCFEQLRDTSNISQNTELGLKFLDYVGIIEQVVSAIETQTTGKPELIFEGFHKMDSIVDVYLLTFRCSYTGRKKPQGKYQEGEYEKIDLTSNLVQKTDIFD